MLCYNYEEQVIKEIRKAYVFITEIDWIDAMIKIVRNQHDLLNLFPY